ncbi:MAG: uracil-xanthine permease [Firmicutes bacterium]|nr:uracil-xanthine permease [Bacillota bacterium]
MKLIYGVKDKPKFGQLIVFAIQQVLAIMAATLAVPMIVGNGMSPAAALFGAGVGTIVYQLFTKFRSPVFLGSSFAFLGSMAIAFAGAATVAVGYVGLIFGALCAALVYVVISAVVKFAGVAWINKIMPAVVIGPTVAIIGLSLAGNAVGDLETADAGGSVYVAIICGLVTLAVTMCCSVYGKKIGKLIPFIIGIVAGYAAAAIFTVIGSAAGVDALKIIDFTPFSDLVADGVGISTFVSLPDFTFIEALGGFSEVNASYLGTIAAAYIPVAFVVFAEHIADHKNLSTIIEHDLLEDPGLHRTLLGDGVGSFAGAIFGGCPNTTYGESIGCVAITGNASVATISTCAVICMIIAFFSPFVAFLNTIPSCVMGGVCIALYGFIAVSGLKMIQKVDLEDNRNLFVVSVILITGIGGMTLSFGTNSNGDALVTITEVACALILGILTNALLSRKKKD